MKTCNNCGAQVEDVAKFCPECGFKFGAIAEPRAAVTDIYDHTSEFSPEDIANNKLYAILMYCVSLMGIIIGLLAAGDSPYVRFHVKQSLKLFICEVLLGLITAALFWTVIVGIVGGILEARDQRGMFRQDAELAARGTDDEHADVCGVNNFIRRDNL